MTADGSAKAGSAAEQALAYVYWHPPAAGVSTTDYEATLCRFHGSMTSASMAGLRSTRVARVDGLAWLAGGGYEDWYVVGSFADLETLNHSAVDPAHHVVHDEIASRSGRGAGALYGLVVGTAVGTPASVTWLSKPRGIPYDVFYRDLLSHVEPAEPSPEPTVGIWRRQLVLGPAPEICVTSSGPSPALPAKWSPVAMPVVTIYAS